MARRSMLLAVVLLVCLPAIRGRSAPQTAAWREVFRETFDAGRIDPEKWTVFPDRSTATTFEAHDGGMAVHIRSESGDRGIATVLKPGPPYRLEYEFMQPANEAGGYRLVVVQPCRDGNAWWFEFGREEVAVWTTYLGGWAPRWSATGLHPAMWYRVTVENEAERVRFTLRDPSGAKATESPWLPHDDLGDPGGVRFSAATGGGLRGCLFDNVRIEMPTGAALHRRTSPIDRELHAAVAAAMPDRRPERLVARTSDGIRLTLDADAAARDLRLGGASLTPPGSAGKGGFYAWEVGRGRRYERFTGRADAGSHTLTAGKRLNLACPALGLRLRAGFTASKDRITVDGKLSDTTGADRPIVLVWMLPMEAGGWTWADSLSDGRTIREEGGYHSETVYGAAGAAGRHLVAPFPWAAIAGRSRGLMLARPLDSPRLMTWWYDYAPGCHMLAVRVELGLSATAKRMPSRASFRFALSTLPRPEWGLRAAAARYYAMYPELFKRRARQEGLWHLWVSTEVRHPEDFGLVFHEQEPFSEDRIRFDQAHGGISFTYSEPNALWQQSTDYDSGNRFQSATFLEKLRKRAAQPLSVTTNYPFSTQPRPLPDAELAQAALNSYVGDREGIGVFWPSPPDRVAVAMNSDPALPRPNRASLWFDYEAKPALTDPRVGGAYIDSVAWGSFDGAEDFRREHWATTDIPLVPSFHSGGVAELAGFSHVMLYRKIAGAMHARGKLVLANTFPFAHLFTAHLLDVMGAGEGGDLESFHDVAGLAYCRALAYHKPVSHMNYAYFKADVPIAQKERALQRTLLYDVWPGSGNVAKPEQIEPLRPLFRRYVPLFGALARAGWEPITEARAGQAAVVERYGQAASGPVYLVAHNPSDSALRASIRLKGALAAGRWNPVVVDRVSGKKLGLRGKSITVDLAPWQTVMLELRRRIR